MTALRVTRKWSGRVAAKSSRSANSRAIAASTSNRMVLVVMGDSVVADLHLAKALDRVARWEVLEFKELTHLDLGPAAVDGRVGEAPRPFERLLARTHLDQGVARDQLLGLGEGTVGHAAALTVVA